MCHVISKALTVLESFNWLSMLKIARKLKRENFKILNRRTREFNLNLGLNLIWIRINLGLNLIKIKSNPHVLN